MGAVVGEDSPVALHGLVGLVLPRGAKTGKFLLVRPVFGFARVVQPFLETDGRRVDAAGFGGLFDNPPFALTGMVHSEASAWIHSCRMEPLHYPRSIAP